MRSSIEGSQHPLASADNPLSQLSPAALEVAVNFAYGQCLPTKSSPREAEALLELQAQDDERLEDLRRLASRYNSKSSTCKSEFKHSSACEIVQKVFRECFSALAVNLSSFFPLPPFSPELLRLCDEIHGACNAVILEFGGRPVRCPSEVSGEVDAQRVERLATSPHLLSEAIKKAMRFSVVAVAKAAQLCIVYARCAPPAVGANLTREEAVEVVSHVMSCIPIFMKQVQRVLSALAACTEAMRLHTRLEMAAHFVPEVRG